MGVLRPVGIQGHLQGENIHYCNLQYNTIQLQYNTIVQYNCDCQCLGWGGLCHYFLIEFLHFLQYWLIQFTSSFFLIICPNQLSFWSNSNVLKKVNGSRPNCLVEYGMNKRNIYSAELINR